MLSWLADLFSGLFTALGSGLSAIVDLALALWYVLVGVVGIAAILLQIALQLANVVGSVGVGLVNTVGSITAPDPSRFNTTAFASGWTALAGIPGFDTLGWVCAGFLWIAIAVSVLRVLRR